MTQILPINMFPVEKHMSAGVWDGTWDVCNAAGAVLANFATQPLAAADSVARNKVLSGH